MNSRVSAAVLAGLALLVGIAYAPSLEFGYPADSYHAVDANPVIERGKPAEIFSSHYWEGTAFEGNDSLYRPVTVLSFALERIWTGSPDPFASHLVNALLHLATALLLMLCVLRFGGGPLIATVAAAIFAAHPLLLQAVSNVVGRADLLAASCSLAALLCLNASRKHPGAPAAGPVRMRAASWGAAAMLFLALGAKEIALATPLLLLAHEALFRFTEREPGSRWWIERSAALAPSGLSLAVYLGLRTAAIEGFPGLQQLRAMDNVLLGLEGAPRVATALAMLGRYTALLFFPRRLSFDYSGTAIPVEPSLFAPLPILGLLVLLLLAGLVAVPWIFRNRANRSDPDRLRLVSVAALLVLLPYSIVGNLLVLNGAGFAERMIYFPATGFSILLAAALSALLHPVRPDRRPLWSAVILLPLLIAGTLTTRSLSTMWKNEQELFSVAIDSTPGSLRAHYSLADVRRGQGRPDEALSLYRRAVEIAPDHAPSWQWTGVIEANRGNNEAAEAALRQAVTLRPSLATARMYLGILLARTGRPAEAETSLRIALRWDPRLLVARAQLAHLLLGSERHEEAARHYRICIAAGRDDLRANLAQAEGKLDH
jgi:tetratricopeptide (TPR) repeat protein